MLLVHVLLLANLWSRLLLGERAGESTSEIVSATKQRVDRIEEHLQPRAKRDKSAMAATTKCNTIIVDYESSSPLHMAGVRPFPFRATSSLLTAPIGGQK